ncbi:growth hormone-inducible transmembrane protein-like [Gigantopelta aegis]|uniref:growth hormone-inducible transmembrane protein-like n=1 Tax=Gigantopelta aegis TaxID=1735272 RepID=UPI001B88C36A|nr:growth hormone-inducible transmembrane protein-like [Gigantopelta aegis]XP_041362835.1 growth hormone-inducible transmembrane protein-like [Gigantopelta aegis]
MLASRLAVGGRVPLTAFVTTLRASRLPDLCQVCRTSRVQLYATETRSALRRRTRQTLKEKMMAPAGAGVFNIGRGFVAGASLLGIGALCYYGLGMSNEVGAIDRSVLWPEEVRRRIRATYMYFGGSIVVSALSAVAVARSPAMMNLMMRQSWLAIGATFAAMIGTGMVCRAIPYREGFGTKQMAWLTHVGVLGAIVAPLTLLGGPILLRAAWYTAGLVGALSTVAVCAPSEKFLNMGGPLAIGLGVVFASSVAGMFLPPTGALGAGLYSISIYGGLVLFSLFLLYDTQKIVRHAETYPTYAVQPFDPINACIGIYLDVFNIFIRIAMILAGGGGRRK